MLPDALHHGGDGAGSIRIPSSMCGVFGLKPTWGLVPTDAVNSRALGAGADQPPRRRVGAADGRADRHGRACAGGRGGGGTAGGLVARPRVLPPSSRRWRRSARRPRGSFAALGVTARGGASAAGRPVADRGCDLVRQPGRAVRRRHGWMRCGICSIPAGVPVIERGLAMAATDLVSAQSARGSLRRSLGRVHGNLRPGADADAAGDRVRRRPRPARDRSPGRPTEYLSWTAFTYPFNVSGQPAATVPCGSVDGLPVGLQIVGRRGADALVLRAAAAFEAAHPWRFRRRE